MTYTYDVWGNLTAKSVYAYTTATDPGTPISTISYGYSTGEWKDQLVSYDGQTIVYDAMGNPTTYRGKTLTWRGKQLTGITAGTDVISYSYDENGLRLQKTVNNVATDYYYNGSVLIGLVKGNDTLRFSYDAAGNAAAVDHNGTYYYYLRNGQGDIVKLIDSSGNTVVEYTYDSWGKPLSCTGTLATTLGALNPFRYRGYVYDEETGFYYLKSRYYDPETCRFISADIYLSTGQGVIGHNCYAYCLNNPANLSDTHGHRPAKGAINPDGDGDEELSGMERFVNYLYTEVANRSIYVWGACGNSSSEITEKWIRKMENRYDQGSYADKAITAYRKRMEQGGDFRAFDCSGLGSYWLIQNGVYGKKKKAKYMYKEDTIPIDMRDLRKGDWVFHKSEGIIVHIGYVVDNNYIIHAKGRDDGVVCEPFDPESWDLAGRPKTNIYGE